MNSSITYAKALLTVPLTLMLITSIGFAVGVSVQWWMFPMGVLMGCVYLISRGRPWWEILIFIGVIGAMCLVEAPIYDFTYDGIDYHLEAVSAMAEGWNPWLDTDQPYKIWTLHYPKLSEIIQACIAKTTGLINCGKAFNLLMLLATVLWAYGFLRPKIQRRWRLYGILALGVLNPVVLTQCFWTTYIDYLLYIYIALTLMLVATLQQRSRMADWMWLIGVGLMSAGTKVNMFFYFGLTMTCWGAWQLYARNWHLLGRIAVATVGAIALALLIFWHPYITNFIGHGHPFYPLMGDGAVDIMSYNTPEMYIDRWRLINFVDSLIQPYIHPYWLMSYDQRVGGFGHALLPLLIISLVLVVGRYRRGGAAPAYAMCCILLSCFIFPQVWWARYIAQLWLVPLIALIYFSRRTWVTGVAVAVALPALYYMHSDIKSVTSRSFSDYWFGHALKGHQVRVAPDAGETTKRLLREKGIGYEFVDSLEGPYVRHDQMGLIVFELPQPLGDSIKSEIAKLTSIEQSLLLLDSHL